MRNVPRLLAVAAMGAGLMLPVAAHAQDHSPSSAPRPGAGAHVRVEGTNVNASLKTYTLRRFPSVFPVPTGRGQVGLINIKQAGGTCPLSAKTVKNLERDWCSSLLLAHNYLAFKDLPRAKVGRSIVVSLPHDRGSMKVHWEITKIQRIREETTRIAEAISNTGAKYRRLVLVTCGKGPMRVVVTARFSHVS